MTTTIEHYLRAAQDKNWSYEWLDEKRNIIIFYPPGEKPIIIRNNVTELSSAIGSVISTYKASATILAKKVGFQVPDTITIEHDASLGSSAVLLDKHKRIVVKPMDAAFGKGVSLNVTDSDGLRVAIEKARANNVKSKAVIAQEFCEGRDFRLLYLSGKIIAAIERVPGKSGIANISQGGRSMDVTGRVHPAYTTLIASLAEMLALDICGVDILAQDIAMSPSEGCAYFIEVNFAPGFKGHYHPDEGDIQDVAPQILDAIIRKRHLIDRTAELSSRNH